MKAIGYCRVSTEEQVLEGFSLDTQEQEIRRYCQENDIELLNVYIDGGVSAYKNAMKDRPQGKFILEHILNKSIDCIIAISDDRMFRQLEDSLVVGNICEKHNVKLIYTRQQHYNQGDPATNFLMKNMNSLINEYYTLIYSVKVKEGIKSKIRKGEWNGQSPFGYNLVKSHLQVNEEEANVIKLIFDLYLNRSWGAEKICNYLNENGIRPPKNSKYWSKTSILCMLKNEAYTGITVYNKRAPEGSGKKYNPQNEWLVIPNTHTPIISKEDFEKVQESMEKKRKNVDYSKVDRSAISSAPLAGLVFCSNCNNLYLQTSGISNSGKKIYYYQCGSKRHGNTVCNRHNIPAVLLEKFVVYQLQEILTSDMYRERFEEQLRLRIESLKAKKKDVSKIKSDIKKLSTQKEKLLNLMLEEDDKLIVDTYKDKLNSVLSQIAFQNETLKVYENIDFEKEENFLREQSKMSYEHITYCDFQELDREQLKILFNKLIERITIDEFSVPGEKEVCLNITINLKIPGYAPKYALQFKKDLKNREKEDKKNTNSHSKSESSYLDGGEGGI